MGKDNREWLEYMRSLDELGLGMNRTTFKTCVLRLMVECLSEDELGRLERDGVPQEIFGVSVISR